MGPLQGKFVEATCKGFEGMKGKVQIDDRHVDIDALVSVRLTDGRVVDLPTWGLKVLAKKESK